MTANILLKLLWERRWILLTAVVVSALAAIPFSLSGPNGHSSTAEVLVPTNLPLPNSSSAAAMTSSRTTVLSERLTHYLEEGLESDVRRQLGNDGSALTDLSVTQSLEDSTFRVTVEATSGPVAESAVEIAARRIISESDAIAKEIVDRLEEEIAGEIEPAVAEISELRRRQEQITIRVESLRQERAGLTSELTASRQDRLRAENNGEDAAVFDDKIVALREDIGSLGERIEALQLRRISVSSDLAVAESRTNTLSQLAHQSTAARLTRLASSSIVEPPSSAGSSTLSHVLQTELIAVLAGFLAGLAFVLFNGRRRFALSRPAGEPSPERGAIRSASARKVSR